MSEVASILIVLAQREFSQGCLSHWLQAHCPEFAIVMAADLGETFAKGAETAPVGVLIYSSCGDQSFCWLEEQMEVKSRCYETVPMILIADGLAPDLVRDLVSRRAIEAVIPTSDTTKIAAAALRLALAGGHYLPQPDPGAAVATKDLARLVSHDFVATLESVLTTRERSVLELLRNGKPNKIIAHTLGMSLSTAKLHVHNIMRKLKVKNRTEAVIIAGKPIISQNDSIGPSTKVGLLGLELPASKNNLEFALKAVSAEAAGKRRSYPGRDVMSRLPVSVRRGP